MIFRLMIATIVGFLVTALGHYYLYSRLVEPLSPNQKALWGSVFTLLWALSFFGFALARAVPVSLRRLVELCMFVWMGTAYLFLLLCLLTATLSLYLQFAQRSQAELAAAVVGLGFALTALSIFQALRPEAVIEADIPVRNSFPPSIQNLKIVVLSDIHVAGLVGARRMRRLAARVNQLTPDLIFVTGDLVDGTVGQLRSQVLPLKHLQASKGVYYITGNHEYYCNPQKWKKFVSEELGWNVLSNSMATVDCDGFQINLMGIEDRSWLAQNRASKGEDVRLALASNGVTPDLRDQNLNILLAHQPKDTRLLKDFPWIDVQISGHTHGGQLWPLYLFVHSDQTYNKGIYSVDGTRTQLYVNQGTGFWGPPMRLGTQCEISVLKLKRVGTGAI